MAATGDNRRIDYVEFDVSNIEACKAFYGKAFGGPLPTMVPNTANLMTDG